MALVERQGAHADEEVADLIKVVAMNPESRDARRELGISYYQQDENEARNEGVRSPAYRRSILTILAAHYNLAILYRRAGMKEKSRLEAVMFKTKKQDPGAPTYSLDYLRKHPEISTESVPWHLHTDLFQERNPQQIEAFMRTYFGFCLESPSMVRTCQFSCIFLMLITPVLGQSPGSSNSATATRTQAQSVSPEVAKAERLVDQGLLEEAMKAIDSLAQRQPQPSGVERLRGKVFYLHAKFEDADDAFQKAIAQNPDDKESLLLRGVTLFRMGVSWRPRFRFSERSHQNLTNLNLDGRYVLALCYLHVNRFDEARHYFAELYRLQPDSAPAYLFFARMLLRWNNSDGGATDGTQKQSCWTRDSRKRISCSDKVALGMGKVDQALAEFEREAAINPMSGVVYDRLGDAYMQKNQFEKAQDALNKALLLEPDATGPYILLGQVLLKRNNPGTAVTYLKRAVEMYRKNEFTHFFLGEAYRDLGQKQDAMREFQISAKIKSSARNSKPN